MIDFPEAINNPYIDMNERLTALRSFHQTEQLNGNFPKKSEEINNHIHTVYSFSPYTPSMAALQARKSGLAAAGSVDHDSIGAAMEMLEACAILGIGSCVGFEVRVSFRKGADGKTCPFADRKINNPDSRGIAYMTVQGVPRKAIVRSQEFLSPIREQRLKRTEAMTVSANVLLKEAGFNEIDFQRDICLKSKYAQGGGITERHLLASAARIIIDKYGKGQELVLALKTKLGIIVPVKIEVLLSQADNPHYLFDLLGILKQDFLPKIFIQPDEKECVPAQEIVSFAESSGAISSYAYLGDVGESPTGDKRAEKYEDDYIEELFAELARLKYRAVTYMPPRNTREQLKNVQRLCREMGFMEITGVDINTSRQSFNCPEVLQNEFRHLLDTTWALIAHERLTTVDKRFSLFSDENPLAAINLKERLTLYANLGKRLNLNNPQESACEMAAEIDKGRFI
ncbi:MAG: PHP domain-containing protein [Treponema sp.]|nr:PHP domain-containing protein [Treponema sp.]